MTELDTTSTNEILDFNDVPDQSLCTNQSKKISKDEIKNRLMLRLPDVLRYLFPKGKISKNLFRIGDVQGNPGKSLNVELNGLKAGLWHDFATGEGGDIIDLWGAVHSFDSKNKHDFRKIIESIQDWIGAKSNQLLKSQPTDKIAKSKASDKPKSSKLLGIPTAIYYYRDVHDNITAAIYRYDPEGSKKEFRPWNAKTQSQTYPEPRPLYNLKGILNSEQVVLVEGEKCAEALIKLGICATTAMCGANAPLEKTDWSPLQNKKVIIWPDHDENNGGQAYADKVVEKLAALGVSSMDMVNIPSHKPTDGWDVANAIDEGIDVRAFMRDFTQMVNLKEVATNSATNEVATVSTNVDIDVDTESSDSDILLNWLKDVWPSKTTNPNIISLRDVCRVGPRNFRQKEKALNALKILENRNCLTADPSRKNVWHIQNMIATNIANVVTQSTGRIKEVKSQANIDELDIFKWKDTGIYNGIPPLKKFLIDGFFPLASSCLLVATGGVGKGMLMLDLALKVVTGSLENSAFGPQIAEHGSVVLFFAEDDKDEIHRRLCNIDYKGLRNHLPDGNEMIFIPLPNAGGTFPIIEQGQEGIRESDKFKKIHEQLKSINNLKLVVFDPLASFVRADINADPSAGALLMSILQEIATETGACVIATHHTSKPSKDKAGKVNEPETIEELYHAIRGTSALGNGARAVYVIGIANENIQKDVFKKLHKPKQRNAVYIGGIGKANGLANWETQTFLRNKSGLLQNVTEQVKKKTLSTESLKELMIKAVADQEEINAFTKTGESGVFDRINELPDELRSLSKHDLENLVQEILNQNSLGRYAKMGSKKAIYLGIPGGGLEQGIVKDSTALITYDQTLMPDFLEAIFQAEKNSQPFNKTGSSAPWKQLGRLPKSLQVMNKQQLSKMTEDAIKNANVKLGLHGREKNAQWLCHPEGPLATDPNNYKFKTGSC